MDIDALRRATLSVLETGLITDPVPPGLALVIDRLRAAPTAAVDAIALPAPLLAAGSSVADQTGPASAGLVGALLDPGAPLRWQIPYTNHDEPDMLRLHAGYRYVPLLAPSGAPFFDDEVAVFATVQATDIHYPAHVHKAPELYTVLAGTADWQWGHNQPTPKPPGSWIDHPTGTTHAMTTTDDALIALAVWTSDIDSVPVIVRA